MTLGIIALTQMMANEERDNMIIKYIEIIKTLVKHCIKCKDEELITKSWSPVDKSLYCSKCETLYVFDKENKNEK